MKGEKAKVKSEPIINQKSSIKNPMIQLHNQLPAETMITVEVKSNGSQIFYLRTHLCYAESIMEKWFEDNPNLVKDILKMGRFEFNVKVNDVQPASENQQS